MIEKPTKKLLHSTFWISHIAIAIPLIARNPEQEAAPWAGLALVVGLLSLLTYFFAIGRWASNMGRSAIVWGGLSMLFSPIGVWISYVSSFFVSPEPSE